MPYKISEQAEYLHIELSSELNYIIGEQFYHDVSDLIQLNIKQDLNLPLLIDFAKVTFIDSYYIGIVMKLYGLCLKHDLKMSIINLSDFNRRMFSFSGMEQYLPIFKTEKEALEYMHFHPTRH